LSFDAEVRASGGAPASGLIRRSETDNPPVTLPARQGFGTRVIDSVIRAANGEVRYNWRAAGLACEISIEA
jgi:two-component sensor histidine kinase